ncbi:MAG: DUF2141 domain-containing protein [Endomicrobiales bacterium]|nr:DUF2141 domain-containing protein [Endomicrobiales bacterium]
MNNLRYCSIFYLTLCILYNLTLRLSAADIFVNIPRVRNSKGKILASLYTSEKGFPSKPKYAYKTASNDIYKDSLKIIFEDINPGTYAVSIVHDENNNGKMDTTWFGMPEEGVGASNNPKMKFGPPSFKSASFDIQEASMTLQIELNYLKE